MSRSLETPERLKYGSSGAVGYPQTVSNSDSVAGAGERGGKEGYTYRLETAVRRHAAIDTTDEKRSERKVRLAKGAAL